MIAFEYVEPESLEEVLTLLEQHGEDAKVLAGGTGLVNLMKQRLVRPRVSDWSPPTGPQPGTR